MYLTKDQIRQYVNLVKQPKASVQLNQFFNSYRKYLKSTDVYDLYDYEYNKKIGELEESEIVHNKYKLNIFNRIAYDYILKLKKPNFSLLEVGCGSGNVLMALAHQLPNCDFVGIDFVKECIDSANQTLKAGDLKNVKFINGNVTEFNSAIKFKFVLMNDISEHLSDEELQIVLEKIYYLLEDGGVIIIHTPNGIALCNDTDHNLIQILYKIWLKLFKNWVGFERTVEQMYYDQVHINIKSFKQLKKILKTTGFRSKVKYDSKFKFKFLSSLSPNMLVIAKKK